MTTTTQTSTPEPVFRSFDAECRAQVLVFIRLGCSRRLAAEMAGCCHTTIGRAAQRDPDFAAQLADAESHVDVKALTRINEVTEENKNWRAAAWILERRHPDEFGRRPPHTFDGKQIMALLARVFDFTMRRLGEDQRKEFLEDFNFTMQDVEAQLRQPGQWRQRAEQQRRWRTYGENSPQEEYRSPYDHPQWEEPKSFERLFAEFPSDEKDFGPWIRNLSPIDFETFRDGIRRWKAVRQEEGPQLFRDAQEIKRQMKDAECRVGQGSFATAECRVGQASPASAGPPEQSPMPDQGAPSQPEPLLETPASSDLPPASTPEHGGPALASSLVPPYTCAPAAQQPLQEQAESDVPPSVTLVPRTAAEHQAYQEWAARQYVSLRHNLLLAQSLQQQPPAAPPAANLAGSAYEQRLKAWTEAMSR